MSRKRKFGVSGNFRLYAEEWGSLRYYAEKYDSEVTEILRRCIRAIVIGDPDLDEKEYLRYMKKVIRPMFDDEPEAQQVMDRRIKKIVEMRGRRAEILENLKVRKPKLEEA